MDNAALDELERVARAAMSYALPDGPVSDDDVQRYAAHHKRLPEARFAFTAAFDPPTILALITAARRPALPDLEAVAREVYNSFSDQEGFVPWVEGGNSDKQFEARRVANRILALSPAQAEREGWVSTGYECEILQGGEYQAGASSDNYDEVASEARHYAAVYGQDGPVEVLMWETARRAMLSAAPKVTT